MSIEKIAKDIIWNDYLKVIVIEPHRGAYEVVKALEDPSGREAKLLLAKDIYTYCQMIADEWLIHPDDTARYLTALHSMRRDEGGAVLDGRRLDRDVRYLVDGEYRWISIELIYPEGYTSSSASCILGFRRTEGIGASSGSHLLPLTELSMGYIKVLKIDPSRDRFEIIKLPASETNDVPTTERLSDWFSAFAAERRIHPDDELTFSDFTDLSRILQAARDGATRQRCKYRRDVDGIMRWVSMELIRSVEYRPDHPVMMLFIRDADDGIALDPNRVPDSTQKDEHVDDATGLGDRTAMQDCIAQIETRTNAPEGVGVLRASMNGLSYMIKHSGSAAARAMIVEFASRLTDVFRKSTCFRIDMDEFAVIHTDASRAAFTTWAKDFRSRTKFDTPPIASIGFAWAEGPDSIDDLLIGAEASMKAEQEALLSKYPHLRSGRRAI